MSEAGSWWNSSFRSAFSFLYPAQCALCGKLGEPAICEVCRLSFTEEDSGYQKLGRDDPLTARVGLYRYRDRARQAVQRLKYDRVTAIAEPMSALIADAYHRFGLDDYDLAVPVPIHWTRRFHRGFNQSELLAEKLPSEKLDAALTARIRATPAQATLSPAERRENIRGAFKADRKVEGKAVVLIDDVFTSGYTARECAKALREAGAVEVVSLTFCIGS